MRNAECGLAARQQAGLVPVPSSFFILRLWISDSDFGCEFSSLSSAFRDPHSLFSIASASPPSIHRNYGNSPQSTVFHRRRCRDR
jgi:hypothetical protein